MIAFIENILDKISSNKNKEVRIPILKNDGSAVFDYNFMMSLDPKNYAYYLCQAYMIKTGQKLNLKHPKTINEKIQWLKIYDNKPIKTTLTDKILVRDWVKEKIGEEYVKPVLQICDTFEEINFDNLPDKFIAKCNHGCKWHFLIKNKEKYMQTPKLREITQTYMSNWLKQSFFGWSDFETQYKDIKPKILVEPLLRDNIDEGPVEIEVWCFNGEPKITQECRFIDEPSTHFVKTFDENLNNIDLKFNLYDKIEQGSPNENIHKAIELSKKLSENFKFVRVDWTLYNNRLYFGEMTFTPFSGFIIFPEDKQSYYDKLGKMINLKGA